MSLPNFDRNRGLERLRMMERIRAFGLDAIAPGRGDVFAEFRIEERFLDELRAATANGEKALRWCETEVVSESGELIARVRKQLYVRRKRRD